MKKYLTLLTFIVVFKLFANGQVDTLKNKNYIFTIGFSTGTLKNEPNFPFSTTYFIDNSASKDILYKNALVEKSKGSLPFRPFLELKYISNNTDFNIGLGALRAEHHYATIFDVYSYFEAIKYISKKRIKPFIGGKIAYLHKNIKDGYSEDGISIKNRINTNAYSLQTPIGIAFSSKHFFTVIQLDLSFLTFIYGKYNSELSGTNSVHSPPDPLIHYSQIEKGIYNKLFFTNNLLNDGYFLNKITFKIGYKFSH